MRSPLRFLAPLLLVLIPFAAPASILRSAENFAALAGTAVTCTDANITGDVGVVLANGFTATRCNVNGTVHQGDAAAAAAYADFLAAYQSIASMQCDQTLFGSLAGLTLAPGIYCVDAATTTTGGTLTLNGPVNGVWLFKVGTLGTGALTGTNFNVVTAGGAQACNVTWWVSQAATLTDSNFQGTILAGADITVTRGTFNGDVLAGGSGTAILPTGAVTLTGTTLAGCEASGSVPTPPRGRCNQGVGNGPEACDPGNSNQGNPARSNDELGGKPGNPGRKGGNGK
jgi:hypothetical protein